MKLDDLGLLAHNAPLRAVHPALDVVDGVLYMTVLLPNKGGRVEQFVLTSAGDLYTLPEEWEDACRQRHLVPLATSVDVTRSGAHRWHPRDVYVTLSAMSAVATPFAAQGATVEAPSVLAPPITSASATAAKSSALSKGERSAGRTLCTECPEVMASSAAAGSWLEAYTAIKSAFDDHLQLCDPDYLQVLTLFAMMTYFHPLFEMLPILHLYGPAQSGKSRAGHVLAAVAFNGVALGSPTPATLFRSAHEGRHTQILTEADHLEHLDSGDAFVRQLQSACYKAEATVDLVEGRGHRGGYARRVFYAFCPRVILSTRSFGSQPLRTRCIQLRLVRSVRPDPRRIYAPLDDDAVWAPLRDRMYRLALMRWPDVVAAREAVKASWGASRRAAGSGGEGNGDTGLAGDAPIGRAFERWLPLATIPQLVSSEVVDSVRRLAVKDAREQAEDVLDGLEMLLARFMVWLVCKPAHFPTDLPDPTRIGTDPNHAGLFLTAGDLYAALTGAGETPSGGLPAWAREPAWSRALGVGVRCEQLRRLVPGWRALVNQLKRLHLISEAERARDHNRYRLQREEVLASVATLLGGCDAVEAMVATLAPIAA